jgi:hypothetical protein
MPSGMAQLEVLIGAVTAVEAAAAAAAEEEVGGGGGGDIVG